MMKSIGLHSFTPVLRLLVAVRMLHADVIPAPLFQNHAVLQQGKSLPVWGTADPGEKVSVTFMGKTSTAVADVTGAWRVNLDPTTTTNSKSATLTIKGNNTIVLSDVLVGEVWLASGHLTWNTN